MRTEEELLDCEVMYNAKYQQDVIYLVREAAANHIGTLPYATDWSRSVSPRRSQAEETCEAAHVV